MTESRRKEPKDDEWHLDKRVNVSMMVALGINAFGLVIWGTSLSNRVTYLEQTATVSSSYGERLARIEEQLKIQTDLMREVRDQRRDTVNGLQR